MTNPPTPPVAAEELEKENETLRAFRDGVASVSLCGGQGTPEAHREMGQFAGLLKKLGAAEQRVAELERLQQESGAQIPIGEEKGEPFWITSWRSIDAAAFGRREVAVEYMRRTVAYVDELQQRVAAVERERDEALKDTILLDHLHAKGLGWISRDSTMGKGWRLHQGWRSGNKATVREAIRAEIDKAREEYEQECRDAMARKYSGGYTGPG